jgi:hypothetical protein
LQLTKNDGRVVSQSRPAHISPLPDLPIQPFTEKGDVTRFHRFDYYVGPEVARILRTKIF